MCFRNQETMSLPRSLQCSSSHSSPMAPSNPSRLSYRLPTNDKANESRYACLIDVSSVEEWRGGVRWILIDVITACRAAIGIDWKEYYQRLKFHQELQTTCKITKRKVAFQLVGKLWCLPILPLPRFQLFIPVPNFLIFDYRLRDLARCHGLLFAGIGFGKLSSDSTYKIVMMQVLGLPRG